MAVKFKFRTNTTGFVPTKCRTVRKNLQTRDQNRVTFKTVDLVFVGTPINLVFSVCVQT